MILKDLGQYATLANIRILNRIRQINGLINYSEQIRNAGNVLICLPGKQDEFKKVFPKIDVFFDIFPRARLSLLMGDQQGDEKKLAAFRVIRYQPDRFNLLGLPSNEITREVTDEHYDITIDTSVSFDFINTFFVWKSRSNLRVGFDHQKRNDFYNFIIRRERSNSPGKALKVLFRYLGAV